MATWGGGVKISPPSNASHSTMHYDQLKFTLGARWHPGSDLRHQSLVLASLVAVLSLNNDLSSSLLGLPLSRLSLPVSALPAPHSPTGPSFIADDSIPL